ncbi:glycosyltransferase family protein [Chitinophaga tropicalis]|uniref:Glycosyltransferase RgtA/B/C/D-like domain-containing protein n=1 Tax=Chitinophaga tropicalis TaxID=2683588 RepID=A0A7K1U6L8_9BACT|nr:glycosyltransferase family 39 protein [Chitinophaga tropicalis]MVT10004.1 hypothetical protein [Chitinophaga tropicalis]
MSRKSHLIYRVADNAAAGYERYGPIVLLLICCFIIRSSYLVTLYYDTDTVTYFYASERILHGIADPLRPPVYPLIMKLFTVLWPRDPFPPMVIFQSICSFLSIIPFYFTCKMWMCSRKLALIASMIYGCLPLLHSFNNTIFPEALLITCYVNLLYIFSLYLKKPQRITAWLLNMGIVVMVLLKPGCLYLYVVLGLIWLIRIVAARSIASYYAESAGYLMAIVLLLVYCQVNSYQNGSFAVSTVTHDNNFANVVASNVYKNIPDKKLVTAIDSSIKNGVYYTIYYLNNDHDVIQQQYRNFPYINNPNMNYVSEIPSSKYGYTRKELDKYIGDVMRTKEYYRYVLENALNFMNSTIFSVKGYMLWVLMLLQAGFVVYAGLIKRNILYLDIFVLGASGGLLLTFFIVGFGQAERILAPVVPLLIFQFFRLLDLLGSVIDIKRLSHLATIKQLQ